MRKLYLCLAAALAFFLTTPMEADIRRLNAVDGYDCAADMSTADCFGPAATSSALYVTDCKAEGRQNQRCRACMDAYNSDGEPMGFKTCNYVRRDGACSCEPYEQNCTSTRGRCNYYY